MITLLISEIARVQLIDVEEAKEDFAVGSNHLKDKEPNYRRSTSEELTAEEHWRWKKLLILHDDHVLLHVSQKCSCRQACGLDEKYGVD